MLLRREGSHAIPVSAGEHTSKRAASPRLAPAGACVQTVRVRVSQSLVYTGATFATAALIAYVPEHASLTEPARDALFVLLSAAGLWITGAIPAFAVSLAVIALQIALLGDPSGPFAAGDRERWQRFVAPWASPVMWLFLSGLVLASAAARTGLDRRLAFYVLQFAGRKPSRILFAIMAVTFVLSMFMSNTATAAMMITLVMAMPAVAQGASPFGTAMLLGIPVAANIGGMATIIGTPPNAIAVAALRNAGRIDFATWMLYGTPVAVLLFLIGWRFLVWRYLRDVRASDDDADRPSEALLPPPRTPRSMFVAVLFVFTVLAWLTEAWHGVPTAVVAVMPIAVLAVSGIVTEPDVRALPWDVLILIAGGLSLGVGVSETGLADWMVSLVPIAGLPVLALAGLLAAIGIMLSTFISNTAAANILMPLALALAYGNERLVVIPLALAMSASMSLPVSTPPTAIAFATGRLSAKDLRGVGILMALLTAPLAVLWVWVIERG